MNKVEETLKKIETLSRTATKSKAVIEAELLIEMDSFVGTKSQILAKEAELKAKASQLHTKYRQDQADKIHQLWIELTDLVSEDEGLKNHPKNKKAWEIAYNEAHSGGYSEIVSYYRTIAELLQP